MLEIPNTITLDLIERLYAEQRHFIAMRGYVGRSGKSCECPVSRLLSEGFKMRTSVCPSYTYFSGTEDQYAGDIRNDDGVRELVCLVDDHVPHNECVTLTAFETFLSRARLKLDKP